MLKSPGLTEHLLKDEGILFINSPTAGDIAKWQKKCGLILPDAEEAAPMLQLGSLEIQRGPIPEELMGVEPLS